MNNLDAVKQQAIASKKILDEYFSNGKSNLEYYKGELTGHNRVLKVVSSHMKGTLPVDLMMNFYEKFAEIKE